MSMSNGFPLVVTASADVFNGVSWA